MNENVTVDEAIKKGHKMTTRPGLLIIALALAGSFALTKYDKDWAWIIAPAVVCALALTWLVWSLQITKWKVWAFEHVRNVHELKKRAIQDKLIWPDESIFNKTEIWSAAGREQWQLLQLKFQRKDEFIIEDDPAVPAETIIYYSKGGNFVEMTIMLLCGGIGVYMIVRSDSFIFGTFILVIMLYGAFRQYKQATDKRPQIIINDNGIQTISSTFRKWEHIKDEDVERENQGKQSHHYLTYKHNNGYVRLAIDDYEITATELKKLLKVYRSRYIKRKEYDK